MLSIAFILIAGILVCVHCQLLFAMLIAFLCVNILIYTTTSEENISTKTHGSCVSQYIVYVIQMYLRQHGVQHWPSQWHQNIAAFYLQNIQRFNGQCFWRESISKSCCWSVPLSPNISIAISYWTFYCNATKITELKRFDKKLLDGICSKI